MALVITEVSEQPDDEISQTGPSKYEGRRSFIIKTNEPARPSVVLNAVDPADTAKRVPAYDSAYDALHPACLLKGKTAKRAENAENVFLVTCDYQSSEGDEGTPDETPTAANPLEEPGDFDEDWEETEEEYFIDKRPVTKGGPQFVTNSAGDKFPEGQFIRLTAKRTLTIVVNEPEHDPVAARQYNYTVNADEVTIHGEAYPPQTLLLKPYKAEAATANIVDPENVANTIEIAYFKKTYILKHNPDGWLHRPLDRGFRELVPPPADRPNVPPRIQPIVDRSNQPVKEPWPLNGKGRALVWPLNSEVPAVIIADPEKLGEWQGVARELWPYDEADWSALSFTFPGTFANPRVPFGD